MAIGVLSRRATHKRTRLAHSRALVRSTPSLLAIGPTTTACVRVTRWSQDVYGFGDDDDAADDDDDDRSSVKRQRVRIQFAFCVP